MLFADFYEIFLPDKRFSAGVNVEVNAKLFALSDDIVDLIVRQIQLVAILCRPAASAVQIAGTCRIKKDRPWDVAVIFFPVLFKHRPPGQIGIDEEIDKDLFKNTSVNICQHLPDHLVVRIILVLKDFSEYFSLLYKISFGKLICPAHDSLHALLRIFI